ncbi:MAG: peptide deformylase [Chloroflexota bacterium]|nr:peptide deformylase [Chloroflexota bacterium]
MAIRTILLEGDPRLRQKATRVRSIDASLRGLAADMVETMLAAPGVGLAGPQVGIGRRLIVVHVPAGYVEDDDPEQNYTLLNPEIVRASGREVATEGCLSIPGWIGDVPRFTSITVKGMDLDARPVRIKARDILARILQHEIDHLDGILYVDRVEDESTLLRVDATEAVEVVDEAELEAELAGRP